MTDDELANRLKEMSMEELDIEISNAMRDNQHVFNVISAKIYQLAKYELAERVGRG